MSRHLYTPSRDQMAQMTKSFRGKMTTVLPPESIVCIQLDGPEETVICMWKGNKHQFELSNEGGDWVVSSGNHRHPSLPNIMIVSSHDCSLPLMEKNFLDNI